MKLNLSKKIALFVGILVVLVSLTIGLISLKISSDAIVYEVEQAMIQYSNEGAKRIDTYIDVSLAALYEVANRERTRTMNLEIQIDSLKEDVERLGYMDMAVVFPDGTAHYVLDGGTADLGDRNYIIRGFQGEANVSDPLVSRVTGRVVMMYAAPIEVNGKIEGVLIGRRDGATLNDITDQLGLGDNGFAFILGADGTVYSHPDREFVMEQRNVFTEIETDESLKDLGIALQKLGLGNTGLANHRFMEVNYITAISQIHNSEWSLGIAADRSKVLNRITYLRNMMLIAFFAILILGVIASIVLAKSISKPITYLVDIIKKMSEYDLILNSDHSAMKSINRSDEIGVMTRAVVKMQNNLINLVKNVTELSQKLASSSEELLTNSQQSAETAGEIAKTIEEISKGASEQAQENEKGVEGITALGEYIEETKRMRNNLNGSIDNVDILKNEGINILKDLVEKTMDSSKAAEEMNSVVLETNKSAIEIQDASEMLKNIASQTNMLALNASIEAARAGDMGKGFAVVAEEIRRLAEQSGRFTDKILKVIKELNGKSQSAVQIMDEASKVVECQNMIVENTNTKFEGISNSIEDMKGLIQLLNESSKKMEMKKENIISTIENLSAISQQNAAGTQEAAASVEEQTASIMEIANSTDFLSDLAQEMMMSIEKFKY
ncbi:UNVERIFIED_CONTAM: methyl-accepting chemotaxis sensory transducer with Cache sensor [Acetivibrio alkalicellulosi]